MPVLEGMREPLLPETLTDPTVGSAQALSERPTVTAGDQLTQNVFDAQDDAFVVRLMEGTPGPTREPAGQTDAQPLQELPEQEPPAPEHS